MKKLVGAIAMFLLAAGAATYGSDEPLEQLIARASAARPDQQPDLYIQVSERELKSATEAYKADKEGDFLAAVQAIVKYSDAAHTAAIQSGKRLTHTEIKIRQIAQHLRDIKLNLDIDEQPPVQAAIDRLEGFRTELLHSMFGTKRHD